MRHFGQLRNGSSVSLLTLGSDDGLQAEVLTLGGTLVSLTMPLHGRRVPLILPLPSLDACLQDRNYAGQLIGRYANQIANAAFELDGKRIRLAANDGRHALHGGDAPFGREQWRIASAREGPEGLVRLNHVSRDGAGGFPGNLDVTATISVTGNSLRLDFEAESDAPTPISFTWHPYFNLSGRADASIEGHRLRVSASSYLPVDSSWIPTGEIASVEGARFDFRTLKPIGPCGPLNQCFVIDKRSPLVAELYCPDTGILMELRSDWPGLQVYDGRYLREQHPEWHGVALEPGGFPDAPNRPNFPDCILRPGMTHRSFMSYSFRNEA